MSILKITENLKGLMKERYYQEGETTPQHMIRRVARYVAEGERQYGWTDENIKSLEDEYFNTMNNRLWIPSSPFLMNAGTKVPMLSACFVVGGLKDDLEAIYRAVRRQGLINKMGGGTGFNFSILREEGAQINSTGGTSSGVMSFMELFNTNGEVIKQGGRRRSANMGILSVYHPEILKFIDYKNDHSKLNNFNISVLVDDVFMKKVETGEDYELISPLTGKTGKFLNAKEVFMKIMKNNWSSAEPALIFVDNLNKNNPMVKHLGYITTTNPCGEVTLYGDEACNLASINLEEFVDWNGKVDYEKLRYITRLVTRFLDTSIDVNMFPDEEIEKMVKNLRRLGIGIMSLQGALIKAGYKYSSKEGREFAEHLMEFINKEAWEMSKELAEEKGVFPLWKNSDFGEVGVRVRNVACTTIAPTGTIQQILNTSSAGCEPMFAITYKRKILQGNEVTETYWVNPFFEEFAKRYGFWTDDLPKKINKNKGSVKGIKQVPDKYQELFETAMEIAPKDHVLMQASLQKWVDNSISKTINLPAETTVEEVAEAYMLGWKSGVKGMTVYRAGSRESEVLSVGDNDKKVELKRGEIAPAPDINKYSKTVKIKTGCGNMYLTMTKDDDGNVNQTFVNRGSKGTCVANQNAVSRLISALLRAGINVNDVIDQLLSVPVCASYYGARKAGEKVSRGSSCPSAIAFALKEYTTESINECNCKSNNKKPIKEEKKQENKFICPECGASGLALESGCISCYSCGWSKCS